MTHITVQKFEVGMIFFMFLKHEVTYAHQGYIYFNQKCKKNNIIAI